MTRKLRLNPLTRPITGLAIILIAALTPLTSFGADWTVMAFSNADNNLQAVMLEDFNEMETAGSTAEVNIVIQFDGYSGDWADTRRYKVLSDADMDVINSERLDDGGPGTGHTATLGELDMGDPAVLKDFIVWAVTNFPADHYLLIIGNHGSGIRLARDADKPTRDISFDDTSDSSISVPELGEALRHADVIAALGGAKIDILGMDACLMAMLEVGHEVRDSVDYMAASEESEPFDGWPYDTILQWLIANPTATPAALSAWIVQKYNQYYQDISYTWGVTQSAVQVTGLSETDGVSTKADALAQAMLDGMLGPDGQTVRTALQTARNYSQYYDYSDFRDLYHFADLVLSSVSLPQAVRDAAGAVKTAIEAAVVENGWYYGGFGDSVTNSNGLAVWLPSSSYLSSRRAKYSLLKFTADTVWLDFLDELWNDSDGDDDDSDDDDDLPADDDDDSGEDGGGGGGGCFISSVRERIR